MLSAKVEIKNKNIVNSPENSSMLINEKPLLGALKGGKSHYISASEVSSTNQNVDLCV